jgi:hypothetical protein
MAASPMVGPIAFVRIYNRALTAVDVAQYFADGPIP